MLYRDYDESSKKGKVKMKLAILKIEIVYLLLHSPCFSRNIVSFELLNFFEI